MVAYVNIFVAATVNFRAIRHCFLRACARFEAADEQIRQYRLESVDLRPPWNESVEQLSPVTRGMFFSFVRMSVPTI
jgi:hypothetical protein